ncbi:MAG: tRNA (adenosine(37)-N6)-threonylcarbamoyltransferase complex dimerization subunit type 1 TsaB [Gemmatimonadaceae bacterium]
MLDNVLVIESSTAQGSVALLREGVLAAVVEFNARDAVTGARTEGLAPAVAECLAESGLGVGQLTAVICGAGPGGFTSLRCAAAVAKAMCAVLSLPLYAVSSLELMAHGAAASDGNYVAALSAGRGEWFASRFSCDTQRVREFAATELVTESELQSMVSRGDARLVGPGLEIDVHPRAEAAVNCLARIEADGPVSLDGWEPAYGRLAEAQVKWEISHGRALPV